MKNKFAYTFFKLVSKKLVTRLENDMIFAALHSTLSIIVAKLFLNCFFLHFSLILFTI